MKITPLKVLWIGADKGLASMPVHFLFSECPGAGVYSFSWGRKAGKKRMKETHPYSDANPASSNQCMLPSTTAYTTQEIQFVDLVIAKPQHLPSIQPNIVFRVEAVANGNERT
ncbi:hypothetical protein TNCV_1662671 [Trichonephila clavipes]|nr:hypothetical protein TNCV_1662671 [Trichonephila clavipes]